VNFALDDAIPVLARTPLVLDLLLRDLPQPWIRATEGPETWSPYDVVGHLISGDRNDWLPRAEILLAHGESKPFTPFDRTAQFELSKGKTLAQLLDEFKAVRAESISRLEALKLAPADLEKTGQHPAFGRVTLAQLLATWVAHDLDHIMQIARVMGKQYSDAVGPWRQYLRIIEGY